MGGWDDIVNILVVWSFYDMPFLTGVSWFTGKATGITKTWECETGGFTYRCVFGASTIFQTTFCGSGTSSEPVLGFYFWFFKKIPV